MSNVAEFKHKEKSLVVEFANRYSVEPEKLLNTLKATAFRQSGANQVSNEQMMSLLVVASQYELNPFTKEIYAFPSNGGISPIVSVDGWMKMINSHESFDGMQFKDHFDEAGNLKGITCIMYRKDRKHPVEVTEYMDECKRNTDPWKKWPARMLRHKAAIQAARYAFSFSGIYDPDEGERIRESTETSPEYSAYTPEQKAYFDQLIETGDCLGMYCFAESFGNDASSPDAAVFVSLTHSFPKGQKGKYGQIINELRRKGEQKFFDIETAVRDALNSGDDAMLVESIEGLEQDVTKLLVSRLTPEESAIYEEMTSNAKPA